MKYNSVFVSDIHLGCKKAKSKLFNEWLKNTEFEKLFLVGDIIDIWRFKQVFSMSYEKQLTHLEVVERLLKKVRKGTEINYIWGNHDEFLAKFKDYKIFDSITLHERMDFVTKSGKKFLVLHGHQFDFLTKYPATSWMYRVGDWCYEILLSFNEVFNWFRRILGMKYWSVSKYIKIKVKRATQFIESFETIVCRYAKERGYDGVICGHLHDPKIKIIDGMIYVNTGCWTEKDNCSFVYEDCYGELKLGKL